MSGGNELQNVGFGMHEGNSMGEGNEFDKEFFLFVSSSIVIHSVAG